MLALALVNVVFFLCFFKNVPGKCTLNNHFFAWMFGEIWWNNHFLHGSIGEIWWNNHFLHGCLVKSGETTIFCMHLWWKNHFFNVMIWNHSIETAIKNWLFGVPGIRGLWKLEIDDLLSLFRLLDVFFSHKKMHSKGRLVGVESLTVLLSLLGPLMGFRLDFELIQFKNGWLAWCWKRENSWTTEELFVFCLFLLPVAPVS